MPWLWLIAGPNGSGKSTLARGLIAKGFPAIVDKAGPPSTVWINPDDVFAELAADPAASAPQSGQSFMGLSATGPRDPPAAR